MYVLPENSRKTLQVSGSVGWHTEFCVGGKILAIHPTFLRGHEEYAVGPPPLAKACWELGICMAEG